MVRALKRAQHAVGVYFLKSDLLTLLGCLLVSLENRLEAGSLANTGTFELGDLQASKETMYLEEDTKGRTTLSLTNMATRGVARRQD